MPCVHEYRGKDFNDRNIIKVESFFIRLKEGNKDEKKIHFWRDLFKMRSFSNGFKTKYIPITNFEWSWHR